MQNTLPAASSPRIGKPRQWIHGSAGEVHRTNLGPEQSVKNDQRSQDRQRQLHREPSMSPIQEASQHRQPQQVKTAGV